MSGDKSESARSLPQPGCVMDEGVLQAAEDFFLRHGKGAADPRGPLVTKPRWEIFCQGYLRALVAGAGVTDALAEAARMAGYKGDRAARLAQARRLVKKPLVAARIGYLLKKSADKSVLALAKRRLVLQKVLESHVGKVMPELKERLGVQNEEDLIGVESVELDPESGELRKLKMRDVVRAAQELNRMDGVYPEGKMTVRHEGQVNIAGVNFVFDLTGQVSHEEKDKLMKYAQEAEVKAREYEKAEDEAAEELLKKLGSGLDVNATETEQES